MQERTFVGLSESDRSRWILSQTLDDYESFGSRAPQSNSLIECHTSIFTKMFDSYCSLKKTIVREEFVIIVLMSHPMLGFFVIQFAFLS